MLQTFFFTNGRRQIAITSMSSSWADIGSHIKLD